MIVVQIYLATQSGSRQLVWAACALTLFPVAMYVFLNMRWKRTRRVQRAEEKELVKFLDHVEDVTNNYRMVADYYRRPLVVDALSQRIHDFSHIHHEVEAVQSNNRAFPTWFALIVMAVWMAYGGQAVLQKKMLLGTFLTVLGIFQIAGDDIAKFYGTCLTMQDSFPSLWNIVKFMNYPEDAAKRRRAGKVFCTPELHSMLTWHAKVSQNGDVTSAAKTEVEK